MPDVNKPPLADNAALQVELLKSEEYTTWRPKFRRAAARLEIASFLIVIVAVLFGPTVGLIALVPMGLACVYRLRLLNIEATPAHTCAVLTLAKARDDGRDVDQAVDAVMSRVQWTHRLAQVVTFWRPCYVIAATAGLLTTHLPAVLWVLAFATVIESLVFPLVARHAFRQITDLARTDGGATTVISA